MDTQAFIREIITSSVTLYKELEADDEPDISTEEGLKMLIKMMTPIMEKGMELLAESARIQTQAIMTELTLWEISLRDNAMRVRYVG